MHVRPAQVTDAPELRQLFYDTVHRVNCKDYSAAQLDAWAPPLHEPNSWQPRFSAQWTFVAEQASKLVGFCELDRDGHIGGFYCHFQHQRQGIGSLLLKHLEVTALCHDMDRLYTEASITAKPFFERYEFQVTKPQTVERHGIILRNFCMEKQLIE